MRSVGIFLSATALLFSSGCADSDLETRVDYLYEIVRQRPLSPDKCASFTIDSMTCASDSQGKCNCVFAPDDQDMEAAILKAAIELRAKQMEDLGE